MNHNTRDKDSPLRRALPLLALGLAMAPALQAQPVGQLTTLHAFSGSDGGSPYGGLTLDSQGNLYGAASTGGTRNAGTLFRISAAGAFGTLYNFTGGDDGSNPNAAPTLAPDGSLYGTARDGSPGDAGTIFKLATSGTLSTLYSFSGNSPGDGGNPAAALLLASDGNFYGSTASGGDNSTAASSVFRITPDGAYTTLYSFGFGADGGAPYGALAQGADGRFYGTTSAAGAHNAGTVFALAPAGGLTTLYSFSGGADGAAPVGGLVPGKDGSFYGTTSSGFSPGSGHGTVFRITTAGTLTTLHSFAGGADGDAPEAALLLASDGNFYGTTAYGGAANDGTVFQITPAGALTTLYSFGGADGKFPMAGLTQGQDGALYGTTLAGGAQDSGTVFKLTVAEGGASSSSSGGASSSGSSGSSSGASSSSSSSGGGNSPGTGASSGGSFDGLSLAVLGALLWRRRRRG